jgi:hypothetical protein
MNLLLSALTEDGLPYERIKEVYVLFFTQILFALNKQQPPV